MFTNGVLAIVKQSAERTESRERTITPQNAHKQLQRNEADKSTSSGADPRRLHSKSAELKRGIACLEDKFLELANTVQEQGKQLNRLDALRLQMETNQMKPSLKDDSHKVLERFECAQEPRADAASMHDELKALVAAQEKRIDTIETALMSVKLEYDTAKSATAEQMKRMDAAENALSSLQYEGNKLHPVDVQCTASDDIHAHANASAGTPKLDVGHCGLDVAMMKIRDCEHILEESVYEAMLLVGIHELGAMGSCLIILSFVLNVLMQVSFCIIVQGSFLTDVLPEPASIERWRVNDAHSYSYIGSSGASMVSRICNGDASLSVGRFQQELLQQIYDYVHSNINLEVVGDWWSAGTTLCAVVLFVWLLCVLQEIMQTLSFIKTLWLQPRGPTHLQYDHDTLRLSAVGSRSLLGMTMVMLLRFGLAFVLLYQGALWLAKTPAIRELVLNACALSFVLDLDQVLFYSFVPLPAKLLVRTLEPLKSQWGPHWKGTGVIPIVNMITSVLFIALVMTYQARPLLRQMRDIEYELCHGNVDFVYSNADDRHFGVIHAADSPAYEASRSTFTEVAVQDVIKTGSPSLSEMVLFWPDLKVMQTSAAWSTGEFAAELASIFGGCSDHSFQSNTSLYLIWTLHWITGRTAARNCSDLRGFCSVENGLVRMACPETCGCSLPRSGLFRSAYSRGCPVEICLASQNFQARLAAIPCEDPSSHQLRDLAGWPRWLEEFRVAMIDFSPETAGAVTNMTESFLKHGCIAARALPPTWQKTLCFGNSITRGMQAFCPVECGCVNSSLAACPPACQRKD